MPQQPSQRSSTKPRDQLLEQNINDLARIISSEARGVNSTEQAMVGWTIVNRMKRHHATRVSAVWHGYSHSHSPSYTSLQLAIAILTGKTSDISQGATHFYSPATMPKEGESTLGWDVEHDDLKSTPGVTGHGGPIRNYFPKWAKNRAEIKVPGVRDEDFKFYRLDH